MYAFKVYSLVEKVQGMQVELLVPGIDGERCAEMAVDYLRQL